MRSSRREFFKKTAGVALAAPFVSRLPRPSAATVPVVDLNVAGPLARSAQDLLLELEVIAGPSAADARAYRWSLPPARGTRLKDYRIGFVLDDPFCKLSSDVSGVLSNTIDALRKAGAHLEEGWPRSVKPQETFDNYFRLLAAFF